MHAVEEDEDEEDLSSVLERFRATLSNLEYHDVRVCTCVCVRVCVCACVCVHVCVHYMHMQLGCDAKWLARYE